MYNKALNSFKDLLEQKKSLKLSSDLIFKDYLSKIYTNLLQREELSTHSKSIKVPRYSMDFKHKDSLLFSIKNSSFINNQIIPKTKIVDKGISLKSFLEYMDIEEFIGERIYKYLNKSKNNKLSKNDFCSEMNTLYYGDINNLIKFSFFLADFNNDGLIYKTDMKLLLVYIPSSTEFSQKLKIKQINRIINLFFDEKIEKNEDSEEKEIKYDIYLKYVEEYINNENKDNMQINNELLNDFNYNAPFFYFISIISYLFKNCPLNVKNVEHFIHSKTKRKLLYRNDQKYFSQKKIYSSSKKDLNYSYANYFENTTAKLDSSIIRTNSLIKKKLIINAALAKIDQKNLFQKKKSSSQMAINNENKYATLRNNKAKKPKNIKRDYIISKNIEKNNGVKLKKNLFNFSKIQKISSSNKSFSLKNSSPIINSNYRQSPNINNKKINQNFFNSSISNTTNGSSNNSSNNLIKLNSKKVSLIYELNEKEKICPLSEGAKLKDEKNEIEEPAEFELCEYSSEEDCNSNKNGSKNTYVKEVASDGVYLYKIDDNENINKLNKYYAFHSEKEILFFNSEQKTELCDLWFIYKSYISTDKEKINGTNYYIITITFNSNRTNKLFFIDEKLCIDFSKKLKNGAKNEDFEENYELLDSVGHGHFGTVYKCRNKINWQIYAVKIINKKVNIRDLELITKEKNYLKLIKHSSIIALKDYFEDKKNIYFVTEYYSGGDLLSFLDKKQKENIQISEKLAAKIIRRIAEGIRYLNFFGIIHRDIKPENIMFAEKNNIKSLKIIDLGVCQTLTYGESAETSIGTKGYISPEIYLHNKYSFKVDIWSLGVILYLLITGGILPFDDEKLDDHIICKKVLYLHQEYPEKYFGNKSKGLISLLDKMLEKNDKKRININELIKDNWFENLKK